MAVPIKLAPGGLMRCCTGTLYDLAQEWEVEPPDGTTVDCLHETPGNANLIRLAGVWQWNRDLYFPDGP